MTAMRWRQCEWKAAVHDVVDNIQRDMWQQRTEQCWISEEYDWLQHNQSTTTTSQQRLTQASVTMTWLTATQSDSRGVSYSLIGLSNANIYCHYCLGFPWTAQTSSGWRYSRSLCRTGNVNYTPMPCLEHTVSYITKYIAQLYSEGLASNSSSRQTTKPRQVLWRLITTHCWNTTQRNRCLNLLAGNSCL